MHNSNNVMMSSVFKHRHSLFTIAAVDDDEVAVGIESIADAAGNLIIDDVDTATTSPPLGPPPAPVLPLNQQKKKSSCSSSTLERASSGKKQQSSNKLKKQVKNEMRGQTSTRRATTGPQQHQQHQYRAVGGGGLGGDWPDRKATDSTFASVTTGEARSASVDINNHNNVSHLRSPLYRTIINNNSSGNNFATSAANNNRPPTSISSLLQQNRLLPHLKTVDITSNDDILLLSEQHKLWSDSLLLRQQSLFTKDADEQVFDEEQRKSCAGADGEAGRGGAEASLLTGNVPWVNFSRRRSTKMAAAIHDQANNVRNYVQSMLQPAVDNKLALKLFGSAGAILREQERQTASARWIVHPASNFRFYWDLLMLLFLLTNMIVLPVSIAFFFNSLLSTGWLVFNCISDTIFIIDICINFRTGVMHADAGGQVILDPSVIARQYFRTWFFVDFISSIPFDYIILFLSLVTSQNLNQQFAQAGRAFRLLRLAKVLSLMKLLRISRLLRYLSQFEAVYFINLAGVFMRIFNFLGLMLLIGHWSGCIQFLVPVLQGLPEDSWVVINELPGLPWFEQYTWSLWQALSHQLSIGYGRFPPQSVTDVWLTTMSMISGASCYALFIGHASNLIQSLDSSRRNYRDKWKQVEEYMVYRRLPPPLRRRIADYYDNRFRGKLFNEVEILEELSDPLKEAIINFNCRDLVKSVPFFTHADPNFVTAVITKLHYEFFQPGDVIVKESTIGDKMYFIQEGVVEIFTSNKTTPNSFVQPTTTDGEDDKDSAANASVNTALRETVITCLSDGSYFGEICLLTKAKRVASVRAQTYCSLFSLQAGSFNVVLEQYPIMRHTLESVAAERLNKIGQNTVHANNLTPGSHRNMSRSASTLLPCDSPPEDLQKVNDLFERVATYGRQLSPSRDLFRRRSTYYVAPILSSLAAPKYARDSTKRSHSSSGNMPTNPEATLQQPAADPPSYSFTNEHKFLSVPNYSASPPLVTGSKPQTAQPLTSAGSSATNSRISSSSQRTTSSATSARNSGLCHTATVTVSTVSKDDNGDAAVPRPSSTTTSVSSHSSPYCSPAPSPHATPASYRHGTRNDSSQSKPSLRTSPPSSSLTSLHKLASAATKMVRPKYNGIDTEEAAVYSHNDGNVRRKKRHGSDDDDEESDKFLSAKTSVV